MFKGLIKLSLHAPQQVRDAIRGSGLFGELYNSRRLYRIALKDIANQELKHGYPSEWHKVLSDLPNMRSEYVQNINKVIKDNAAAAIKKRNFRVGMGAGAIGLAGIGGLGYYLSRRKRQGEAPVTAI